MISHNEAESGRLPAQSHHPLSIQNHDHYDRDYDIDHDYHSEDHSESDHILSWAL